MNPDELGKYIRKYRKQKGLTQEQLGKAAGISTMSIRRYECGDRIVSEPVLQRIADALGVSTDYLLGKSEEIAQPENQLDDFSAHLLEITKDLSEVDRQLVLGMARRLRDTGKESGAVMTSKGPYYLYNYPDGTEPPLDAPAPSPESKDTPGAAPPENPAENGG